MTFIEITFLGTTASIPTKYRNHAAIYLRYQSENEISYLFDCGEGTQKQIFIGKLNFMRINDIFITHWHADHFAGLLGLIETMNLEGRKNDLRIFGPEAEKFMDILQSLGYSSKDFNIVPVNVEYDGHEIEKLVETEEYIISAIPVEHGIPAVAYCFEEKDRIKIDKNAAKKFGLPLKGKIFGEIKKKGSAVFKGKAIKLSDISKIEKGKKVVYTGDTQPCQNVVKISKNADLLIHDSTFFEEAPGKKHASFKDVLDIAKKAGAKKLVLTHISRRYQDLEELKNIIKEHDNVSIAKDFMKVVLQ